MASALFAPSTSSTAFSCTPVLIGDHLMCSICLDLFEDPVTTPCGHTFCKGYLERNMALNDLVCPLCKDHLRRKPEVNIILRELIQELKRAQSKRDDHLMEGDPGEVTCDVCTGSKLRALKSCLVCLTSYCETHLEPHFQARRLKGHRLVAPVEDLDGRACLTHGRPLELYSREDERCVCALCLEEGQEVVSTETEWEKKKAELEETIAGIRQKVDERKRKLKEINESVENCKARLDRERRHIQAAFGAVMAAVLEAQEHALRPLEERQESLVREGDRLCLELQGDVSRLGEAVSKMDDIANIEDHILFLQTFPSLSGLANGRDWTAVSVDTSLSFGTLRGVSSALTERTQQELEKLTSVELERIQKFEVAVTLDTDTANAQLAVSADGREVRHGASAQERPDAPGRFDLFASVLAVNRLSSGRSYWEVEVGDKTGWDLGVASEDANRKGKLTLNPTNGYWAIVLYNEDQYGALEDPPTLLHPRDKPRKVGVFVDYEEGLVSFYDVEAGAHIHSYTGCGFTRSLYPYFSPHLQLNEKNGGPLTISPVKHR
ncbi:E3 ubiquitin-protein ligase TRIM39-like [Osmerus eperlanus]|uniref:E3 ubiquitin-protein ligase TRIM39-like n=1 Tax=Osmerus eperlanus TaxID=29151 RepID=UPI002E1653E7